jgi:hypothetical protein
MTEATIDSLYFDSTTYDVSTSRITPIGRPFANTQSYLLDSHLQLVPSGVPGELYIGGAGLARGYLGRPSLTAERFIPNLFGSQPGARLYKTRDLGRYLPDGNVEFLGRSDEQVKVRGFRIELGEIEAVLGQQPDVKDSVVIVREDTPGEKRLVAYVVAEPNYISLKSRLRDFLKSRLPGHMVPSVFVFLDALPLTANGKLDRQSLPQPATVFSSVEAFVAPRTDVEKILAKVWAEVLSIDRIGIHDNFFDLGGYSLQAVQLAAKISALCKQAISIKVVFTSPTIAEMVEVIGDALRSVKTEELTAHENPRFVESDQISICREECSSITGVLGGENRSLQAAAIAYLPDILFRRQGLTQEEYYKRRLAGAIPVLSHVLETPLGSIGVITIPRFRAQLYGETSDILVILMQALHLAGRLGAATVSLTGLLPSATEYGRALLKRAVGENVPTVTTGHETTTAAVALAVERIVSVSGRCIADETLGIIGVGSIGMATIYLILDCLPHPKEIILCDVFGKREFLIRIKEQILEQFQYHGRVRIVQTSGRVPRSFYEATTIVGATNAPGVVDISQCRPGTLIVDDSSPHCFSTSKAVERLKKAEDILFTEGGVLRAPYPIRQAHYRRQGDTEASGGDLRQSEQPPPRWIKRRLVTGCILSALLCSRFSELSPTVGLVKREDSRKSYNLLQKLGFTAAPLHCDDYRAPEEIITSFRSRFGTL